MRARNKQPINYFSFEFNKTKTKDQFFFIKKQNVNNVQKKRNIPFLISLPFKKAKKEHKTVR